MDRRHKLAFAILCLLIVGNTRAQTRFHSPTPNGPTSPSGVTEPAVIGSSVIVAVVDEAGMPIDKQAIVKLFDDSTQSVTWGNTQGRTEAQFDNVKAGEYEIEVSAPGYKTTRQDLSASSSHEAYRVLVTLPLDTPGAVTETKPGQLLAPKARKELEKGMEAFKEGRLPEAQRHLEAAFKLAPGNADVNYLLGLLFVQEDKLDQARQYLNRAVSLDSRHVGALTELGHVLLLQGDSAGAVAVLEPSVLLDAKQWRGHWLLADAYLHEHKFEKAYQQSALALQQGKGNAVEARFTMAEALAALGRKDEAIRSLREFLQADPQSAAAPRAKALVAKLSGPTGPAAPTER